MRTVWCCFGFVYFCFYFCSIPHLCLITGFLIRVTRRVPIVEQKQKAAPELNPVFKWCLCCTIFTFHSSVIVNHCLYLCPFSCDYCISCHSLNHGLWLPLLESSKLSWCFLLFFFCFLLSVFFILVSLLCVSQCSKTFIRQ